MFPVLPRIKENYVFLYVEFSLSSIIGDNILRLCRKTGEVPPC